MIIEVCGGIGSGKTTLCKSLESYGVKVFYEDFQKNPFFEDFYNSPNLYAFETEIVFLLMHYNLIKKYQNQNTVVFDFSLLQDLAYSELNLNNNQIRIFNGILNEIHANIKMPDLLINIKCSPKEQLRRIKQRGRMEESSINQTYLERINDKINTLIQSYSYSNIMNINSEEIDLRKKIPDGLLLLLKK